MYQDNNNVHRIKKISIFNPLTAIFLSVGLIAQLPLEFFVFSRQLILQKFPQAGRKKYTPKFCDKYTVQSIISELVTLKVEGKTD